MKHLKLFEAYSQIHKVEMVNNILIEYFLFNYFVNNDICVRSSLGSNYGFKKDDSYFLWIDACEQPEEQEAFRTSHTKSHFLSAFSGRLDDEITEKIAWTKFFEIQGILWAGLKYINYLRTTPEKNHLLQE